MTEHRVVFDFEIDFANGGGLQGQDFRLDIDRDSISDAALADLLVRDLRLLMVSGVRITNKRVIEEKHKRRGTIDLSHPIRDGMVTYPGIPGPAIGTYLSREASRERYATGTEFFIGTISMVATTGTYLDAPFHRFPEGPDLSEIAADKLAFLPGVLIRARGMMAIGPETLAGKEVAGRAVLFQTGWDRFFGQPEYGGAEAPFLTEATGRALALEGAALVGIDSLNIDSTADPRRPVHTTLLAAGIPIVEHMTGLDKLPDDGFEVTALPARVEGLGSFPVRVVART
jgi:arylformamidase